MSWARLAGRITDALRPGKSPEQQALGIVLGSHGYGLDVPGRLAEQAITALPEPVVRALAAEATFRPYAEPHDRRQFFRNALGLPHRGRQVAALAAERHGMGLSEEGWERHVVEDPSEVQSYRERAQRGEVLDPIEQEILDDDNDFSLRYQEWSDTMDRARSPLDPDESPTDELRNSWMKRILQQALGESAEEGPEATPVYDAIMSLVHRLRQR